jgi:hypothetical protein
MMGMGLNWLGDRGCRMGHVKRGRVYVTPVLITSRMLKGDERARIDMNLSNSTMQPWIMVWWC